MIQTRKNMFLYSSGSGLFHYGKKGTEVLPFTLEQIKNELNEHQFHRPRIYKLIEISMDELFEKKKCFHCKREMPI